MVDSLAALVNLLLVIVLTGGGVTLGLGRRNSRMLRRQAREKEAAEQWRYEVHRAVRAHNLLHHLDHDDRVIILPPPPEWMTTDEPEDPLPLPRLGGPHA